VSDFLQGLRKNFDKGVNVVAAKSKEVLEAGPLKSRLRLLESERDKAYLELGSVAFDLMKENPPDVLLKYFKALDSIHKEIQIMEKQIQEVQLKTERMISLRETDILARCSCGYVLNESTKFCGKCGRDVRPINADAVSLKHKEKESIRCACGEVLKLNSRFCPACGSPVNTGG
jgi:NADH pyrophosphatase NudC (nudix superfamily)